MYSGNEPGDCFYISGFGYSIKVIILS